MCPSLSSIVGKGELRALLTCRSMAETIPVVIKSDETSLRTCHRECDAHVEDDSCTSLYPLQHTLPSLCNSRLGSNLSMQADRLLALRQSAHHVANYAPSLLGAPTRCKLDLAGRTRPHILSQHDLRITKRSTSSRSHVRNHLRDVKAFTDAQPISIWRSTSNNPYENLAIENYLLKNSDPASRILFTYVNWPCVVIGRNQNPWLECNLVRMQQGLPYHRLNEHEEEDYRKLHKDRHGVKHATLYPLDLVRRRSGGGTVIHDAGNLNFSFIVPNDKDFTRDTHGYLVASMLQKLRVEKSPNALYSSVRVNERHDIVMKLASAADNDAKKDFKVSGSAFKLTRGRALHHGTILHSSPNILEHHDAACSQRSVFSQILSSPAKPYLEAKGVGSVRSPVHNLFKIENDADRMRFSEDLRDELQRTFQDSHEVDDIQVQQVGRQDCNKEANEQMFNDIQELMTDDWRFCQTPSFEYSSSIDGLRMRFQVKHGIIGTPVVQGTSDSPANSHDALAEIEGKKLHEINDWARYLSRHKNSPSGIVSHLATVFPTIHLAKQYSSISDDHEQTKVVRSKRNGKKEVKVVERRSSDGSVETEKEGENLVVER